MPGFPRRLVAISIKQCIRAGLTHVFKCQLTKQQQAPTFLLRSILLMADGSPAVELQWSFQAGGLRHAQTSSRQAAECVEQLYINTTMHSHCPSIPQNCCFTHSED